MFHRDLITVGASVGGVKALLALSRDLPKDLDAAVCVVLHTRADGPNLMPGLMDRAGPLHAKNPADGEPLEPGRIYIAPPDRHMLVVDGHLRLGKGPKENHSRPSIDALFRTAAVSRGPRTIGVILSGSLGDGRAGMAAIKRCGGTAVVQRVTGAVGRDLPQNVISSVPTDHVVPIDDLGSILAELTREMLPGEGEFAVPKDLKIESDITMQNLPPHEKLKLVQKLGTLAPLTCPDCGGSLWQIHGGEIRYRCHVGHAYSAEAMARGQDVAVEAALWSAVRALEEQRLTSEHLGRAARDRSEATLADQFAERAVMAEEQSKVINDLLLQQSNPKESPTGSRDPDE